MLKTDCNVLVCSWLRVNNGIQTDETPGTAGSRPDAETYDKIFLIKGASELRVTYQIRLLAFLAMKRDQKLIIAVRKECKIHEDLREFVKQYSKNVKIMRE